MTSLKNLFLLDPNIVFLNHGSFGACSRPVFDAYQTWQLELERQPVEFLGRRSIALLEEARVKLADFLEVEADDVVYFPNPTTAINMIARSLSRLLAGHTGRNLQSGDEILTTDHEYGAMDRTWRYICSQNGLRYIRQHIPLPVTTPASFLETFWSGVNRRTRVIFISHITSPTALTFPVEEICRRARQSSILSIVDGAHAPGQIPLNLERLGADIYTGAIHKWLCSPKGSSFLYVRREIQEWLDPLVISWGYQPDPGFGSGNAFIDYHEWQGTRDLAAFLSVPDAIEFQEQHNWKQVRQRCHTLAVQTRQRLDALTGLEPICPDDWFHQMSAIRLPQNIDLDMLKVRLYDKFHIEVPMVNWNNQKFIRVSFQGYNNQADADALLEALEILLPLSASLYDPKS